MQINTKFSIIIYLLTAIFIYSAKSNSVEYFKDQDSLYPSFESIVNHKKLHYYLSQPDTLNLQKLYGWGRDLGLKYPEIGLWISDTLLALAKDNNDHRAVISAYSLSAQMYEQKADIYNSIKSFKNAIRYGEENLDYHLYPNFDKLGINYVYLGDLYYDIGDIVYANIYYQKGWEILGKISDKMINEQDSINKYYERDYTTYRWDKTYSKLKVGLILSEEDSSADAGIKILNEVLNTNLPIDGLLKINASFYLGKAYYHKNQDLYKDFLKTGYKLAKEGLIYDLQSKIGYFILDTDKNYFDTTLAFEVLGALSFTNNLQIKHQLYKKLSKYYESKNNEFSKNYLDSAYYYQAVFFDKENQIEIGKIQSDIEYQEQLNLTKIEKEISDNKYYYTLIVLIILIILISLLFIFLYNRNKLMNEIKEKNQKISIQNNKLVELINSREQLIGIIGHDLRNPIKGFKLTASHLKKSKDDFDKNELDELEHKAVEIESLLNNILDYAESNLNVPLEIDEKVNLKEVISSIEMLNLHIIKMKNIRIEKDLLIDTIKSNLFILTNVLNNVISNAIKFSYNDSTINISTSTEDSFIIIKIKDYGIGIEPANIEKIESQIKPDVKEGISTPKGNGFGLLTAISQLDKISGNLFIESKIGEGTTVFIYINN